MNKWLNKYKDIQGNYEEIAKEEASLLPTKFEHLCSRVELLLKTTESLVANQNQLLAWQTEAQEKISTLGHSSYVHFSEHVRSLTNILERVYNRIGNLPALKIEDEVKTKEQDEATQKFLKTRILDQELSVRTQNCLESAGIKTVEDLTFKSSRELLKLYNFGKKSLKEVRDFLADENLTLNEGSRTS